MTELLASDLFNLRQSRISVPAAGVARLPSNAAAAYRVAFELAALQGCSIGAWKLGATTEGTRAAFATEEIYFGAILDNEIFSGTVLDLTRQGAIRLPRYCGEAEIALRIACDLSADEAAHLTDTAGLFDAYAPAVECPWSVVSDLPDAGLTALLMDRCASGALFLAAPRSLDEKINTGTLAVKVDGREVAVGRAETALLMLPRDAALRAVQIIGATGHGLAAGQWISTGGITPCTEFSHDAAVDLIFDGALVLTIPPGWVAP